MSHPVLDDITKDAEIIGYAATEAEASEIMRRALIAAGNDADDIAALEAQGVLTMTFRPSPMIEYANIDAGDLARGFFDNA